MHVISPAKEEDRMGRGDKRSKKGKIWRGTNGKVRPKKKKAVEKPGS
jgi:30S ribosomal protein S31